MMVRFKTKHNIGSLRLWLLACMLAPLLLSCWQNDEGTGGDLPTFFTLYHSPDNVVAHFAADTLTIHAASQDGSVIGIAVRVPEPNDSTLRYDVLWNGASWNDDTLCVTIPESYIPQVLWEQGRFNELSLYRCFSVDDFANRAQEKWGIFITPMLDLRGASFLDSLQIQAMGLVGACPTSKQAGRYADGYWITEQGSVLAMGVTYQGERGAFDEWYLGGGYHVRALVLDSTSGLLYSLGGTWLSTLIIKEMGRADGIGRCEGEASIRTPPGAPTWFEYSHPQNLFTDKSRLNLTRNRFLLDSTDIVRAYYDTSSAYMMIRLNYNFIMLAASGMPKAGDSLTVLNANLSDATTDIVSGRPTPDYAVVDSLVDGVLYGRTGYSASHSRYPNEYWSFAMQFKVQSFEVTSCNLNGMAETVCPGL